MVDGDRAEPNAVDTTVVDRGALDRSRTSGGIPHCFLMNYGSKKRSTFCQ